MPNPSDRLPPAPTPDESDNLGGDNWGHGIHDELEPILEAPTLEVDTPDTVLVLARFPIGDGETATVEIGRFTMFALDELVGRFSRQRHDARELNTRSPSGPVRLAGASVELDIDFGLAFVLRFVASPIRAVE